MLHELLLTLNGYPGCIFTKKENGNIQVVSDLPFMQESEEAALNILCKLATHYVKFQTFIRDFGSYPCPGTVGPHGLYLEAFCEGLNDVLNTYREVLLEIEEEILSDPNLTAYYIAEVLEMYQELFPVISQILDQIHHKKAHGCLLLEILYNSASNGVPKLRHSLLRILHVCQGVFFRQLASWMLHGMLMDRYNEFFIFKLHKMPETSSTDTVDDELGLAGVSAKQIGQLMRISDAEDHDRQFALRSEMIPSYLPVRIAEKILFVGESVQMFESEKPGAGHNIKRSILNGKEEDFSQELINQSQHSVFEVIAFDEVVDRISVYVSKQLWSIVVEEANLVGQLQVMKDFFLLGRGELFLAFIDRAKAILKGPPTSSMEHDVAYIFQQAARNVLIDDDHLLQQFSFTVDSRKPSIAQKEVGDKGGNKVETGWNTLNMKCTVDWPLHILMTPAVIDRYNSLFKFLLLVKRVQLELQQCWIHQMENRIHVTRVEKHKWWLRNHLAFLVDNLQYYLQVDVIESQFSVLLKKIQKTHDFEAVRFAHDQFLTSLLSQSFLLMKPVAQCLNDILDVCHQFCTLVLHSDTDYYGREHRQLEDITKSFQRHSNLLFKILSNVKSHQASAHLSQLLLRIDYNKYFSHCGGQLGSFDVLNSKKVEESVSYTSSSRN